MASTRWIAALALVAAPLLLGGAPPQDSRIKVGQAAPPFKLKTFAREDVTLARLRGKVIVINLWATWCAPRKREMPMMDAYFRANRARGLHIYGVHTEDSVPPIG